jgi:dihydrofolate synthase / folylpolyglutamate synthase
MTINSYEAALDYLYSYIPRQKHLAYWGEFGLERSKQFLKLLGDPQNQLKIIHVAGTSGKGSTAFFTSQILSGLGFKVGLHVSPHLVDLRERFQINHNFLSKEKFSSYVNSLVPVVEELAKSKFGAPTYFEMTVALAYLIFYKEHVDYAVIETGLGGLLDATNVVTREDKVNLITQIGHDHMEVLGKTLDKIAFQKAGIIQPHNLVITGYQNFAALRVIENVASQKSAQLIVLNRQNVKTISLLPSPHFNFQFSGVTLSDVQLNMLGSFQILNCSLALACVVLLSQRDHFDFNQDKVKSVLSSVVYPGRMQRIEFNHQTLILDGSHNPQKMNMFSRNLRNYFPGQKFTFIIGLKQGKAYRPILKSIIPHANKIILTPFFNQTRFQGQMVKSEDPDKLAIILSKLGFRNYIVTPNPASALKLLLKDPGGIKVITGSFYLLSELYPSLCG